MSLYMTLFLFVRKLELAKTFPSKYLCCYFKINNKVLNLLYVKLQHTPSTLIKNYKAVEGILGKLLIHQVQRSDDIQPGFSFTIVMINMSFFSSYTYSDGFCLFLDETVPHITANKCIWCYRIKRLYSVALSLSGHMV